MRSLASLAASLCLTLAACSGGTCGQPQEDSEIPLLRTGGEEVVPVMMNGQPGGLLLDTGAFLTTVTPDAAHLLHLFTTTSPLRSEVVGGTVYNQPPELTPLKLGGAEVPDATALVLPLSSKGLGDFPVYGLAGADLLVNWDLDLDAANNRLTLYEPQQCQTPSAPFGSSAQIVSIPKTVTGAALMSTDVTKGFVATTTYLPAYNGEILFPVTLDGRRLMAQLDTGASRSTVRQDAVGLDDAALANDPSGHGVGPGLLGVDMHSHAFHDLRIDDVDYGPVRIQVGRINSPNADLLLGEDFLRRHRVYIAFHAGKLIIARSQ